MTEASFFSRSGLSDGVLARVWNIASKGATFLDKNAFVVALRLIGMAQKGIPLSVQRLEQEKASGHYYPPSFQDAPPSTVASPQFSPTNSGVFPPQLTASGSFPPPSYTSSYLAPYTTPPPQHTTTTPSYPYASTYGQSYNPYPTQYTPYPQHPYPYPYALPNAQQFPQYPAQYAAGPGNYPAAYPQYGKAPEATNKQWTLL